MTGHHTLSRRTAVKTLSAGLAGLSGGVFSGLAARPALAANDLLQVACIGVANRAADNVGGVAAVAGAKIVAMCDVDDTFMARQTKPTTVTVKEGDKEVAKETPARFPDVRTYVDYRELIEKEVGKVDAVVVSTADHHHAPASLRAIRKKMHVYCEKPLAHTVAEARLVAEEAAKAGVTTQLGPQIPARDNYRRVVEIIRGGAIGPVTEVHVWVGKAWGGGKRPEGGQTPPPTLHWDLWLGPAAERPHLESLVGLRQRHAGRHGLPLHGSAVLGPRPEIPDRLRGGGAGGRSRNLSARPGGSVRLPSPRRAASSEVHLV